MKKPFTPSIPGMSLTSEPGNRPWEQPPLYTTLEEVVDFYTEALTTDNAVKIILSSMEKNVPLMDLAQIFIKMNLMKGLHSIDVGFLAVPVIIEMMKTIGDMNDVGYIVESEDFQDATEIDEETAKEVLRNAVAEVKQAPAVRQSGLMAKE